MEGKGKGKGYIIGLEGLRELFYLLSESYKVIAPTLRDGLLVYDHVKDFESLALGYKNVEGPALYAVEKASNGYFTYTHPANSPKAFLHPPELRLMKVRRSDGALIFEMESVEEKYCFFDVKACDLSAIKTLDRVFLEKNQYPDPYYKSLRERAFIVAVNCTYRASTCFCNTMGAGPEVKDGFDLLITELEDSFLLEVGSERGEKMVSLLEKKERTEERHFEEKERKLKDLKDSIEEFFDREGLAQRLYGKMDSSHWEHIEKRCLACTSCTQVCPTCFCFDIVERNSLESDCSERIRLWDSCFSPSFATVHRFNLRQSIHSRYRQWLMHKFAYWVDQFDSFGCVGCGRCITWCPAGIDIRQEVKRLAYG